MANVWQRALFYLGLVDEDESAPEAASPAGLPRTRYRGEAVAEEPPVTVTPARRQEPVAPAAPAPRPGEPRGSFRASGGRRVEPPVAPRRRTSAEGALSDAGVILDTTDYSGVRTVVDHDLETHIITARTYADAQLLADHIRAGSPVVLDLRKVEPAMVRRLVDFASGLTYALGGSMRKIGQGVILVTPANVNVGRDERRRLQSLGYYQVSEGL
ncbi:MAG TPA: cell division protein SepF [Acidimicrobiia bacterium]|nr:cell division protein SepF [Acidimicrobiia bacterium]